MSDRILGAACVVASAGMAWSAQGYAAAISYEPVGPRAFPLLLACGLLACRRPVAGRPKPSAGSGATPYRGVPLEAPPLLCGGGGRWSTPLLFEWTRLSRWQPPLMAVPAGPGLFGGSLEAGAGRVVPGSA